MGSDLLIRPAALDAGLSRGEMLAVDCRFDLADVEKGRRDYRAGHVPGARYAHLDHDLSSTVTPDSGRHPLPAPGGFAGFLARIGWRPAVLLVAYDERNNAMAARLWWLMRFFGQPAGLLDGGLAAWQRAGYPIESVEPMVSPADPPALEPDPEMTVSAAQITGTQTQWTLVDARAAERFSGEVEPLDARGGHIPGALNRPLGMNLDVSGQFKPADRLQKEFRALLGETNPDRVVNYCGSGVTACHNQFALELAGISGSRIYPGSWSEWLRDPQRPVATGRE